MNNMTKQFATTEGQIVTTHPSLVSRVVSHTILVEPSWDAKEDQGNSMGVFCLIFDHLPLWYFQKSKRADDEAEPPPPKVRNPLQHSQYRLNCMLEGLEAQSNQKGPKPSDSKGGRWTSFRA